MKKLDILFDKSINSKRVVVTTDRYNWIIMEGSQKLSWKNFQRKAKHSYFSKLESLYLNLYSILFKEELKSLNSEVVLQTMNAIESKLITMGNEIEKKLMVEKGWKYD